MKLNIVNVERRRERRLQEAHAKTRAARARLRSQGVRLLPAEARFAFVCGHEGCSKPYGHGGGHGPSKPE